MVTEPLVFGWRTALLLVAWIQLLLLAGALTRVLQNRTANRTLALLLILLAGLITPWMIGFAGFYDRWRWLSFAPLAIPLGIAPLAYLYAHALVRGGWTENYRRHLLLPGLQFAYLGATFLILRQPLKNEWLARSSPVYDAVISLCMIGGLALYATAGHRLLAQYRAALSRSRSDDHRFALRWLGRAASVLAALLVLWAVFTIWDLLSPLGYRGLMGLYIVIAAAALYLGIEGWRHAALAFPQPRVAEPEKTLPPDWAVKAEGWSKRIVAERLYADPELSVARLARILGTNSAYVSRAFNAGLGASFSDHINRLRCDEVAERLRAGIDADLLTLALEAGFSSKASFNRAFRRAYASSPSAYRRAYGSKQK